MSEYAFICSLSLPYYKWFYEVLTKILTRRTNTESYFSVQLFLTIGNVCTPFFLFFCHLTCFSGYAFDFLICLWFLNN